MLSMLLASAVIATPYTMCPVPEQAYEAAQEVRATGDYRDSRPMVQLMLCVCGPQGVKTQVPQRDDHGQEYLLPVCQKLGWNGVRYARPR